MLIMQSAKCQYDSLKALKDHSFKAFYSEGNEMRAVSIASRIDKAITYHQQLLGFRPTVKLLILNPADWAKYTSGQMVYGMPHYTDDKTLVVAAQDNPFWKSFVPPLEQLPEALRTQIQKAYTMPDGSLSMQAFFDLLAIHELGHAFHLQPGLTMQRKWMGELFPNIFLHTYIAEKEPESLAALTLFPQMVIAAGKKEYKYTTLNDIEERYKEIGLKFPKNYGWYQSRWHKAAADIYIAGGKQVLIKLFNALKSNKEILTDDQLVKFLETSADKSVADVMRNWDTVE
jgi:hypothetical protein